VPRTARTLVAAAAALSLAASALCLTSIHLASANPNPTTTTTAPTITTPPATPPLSDEILGLQSVTAAQIGVHVNPVPPQGYDPTTNADASNATYGIPPRPTNAVALASWNDGMHHIRKWVDPGFKMWTKQVITHGNLAGNTQLVSENWAGNYDVESAPYRSAAGWILAPHLTSMPAGNRYDSNFVGLGGDSGNGNDPLIQAGSEADSIQYGGFTYPQYYSWWEIAGITQAFEMSNIPAGPGTYLIVQLSYNAGQAYPAAFFVQDYSSGATASFSASMNGQQCLCNSADFITERPLVNNQRSLLSWFDRVDFANSYAIANDTQGWVAVGSHYHDDPHMYRDLSGQVKLAYPSAWEDPGTWAQFPVFRTNTD